MYFIHKGIVEVFSTEEHAEVLVDELEEMDCFGMVTLQTAKSAKDTKCVTVYLHVRYFLTNARCAHFVPFATFRDLSVLT